MKIFDFNIHLYSKERGELSDQLKSNTQLSSNELIIGFEKCKDHLLSAGLNSANFMLFNQEIIQDSKLNKFISKVENVLPNSSFTLLFDFRNKAFAENITIAKRLGVKFIKFHCYTQRILETEFIQILECCKLAQDIGLGICIDASFGTTGLYKYDNLKLAAYLAENITKAPIILLHSGGARVFDAMLIADLCPNVYLETSLSLDFYKDSSIMQDFAFAYKKIGLHRVLYASDYPYKKVDGAINDIINLCDMYGISDVDKENILYNNAIKLLKELA
jgi:uncharacterized protein